MGQQNLPPDNEDQLVTLGRTLQSLREAENADVLIETTLEYLKTEFKYRLIWIGLYDRLGHCLVGKGGITPNGDKTLLKQRYNLYPGDLLEQVVIQQRPVGVPDLRQEIRAGAWRQAAQEFGIQGTLIFPLRCKNRCHGLVLLGSPLWGISPRPAEKAQLSLVLGGLASALYELELEWQRSTTKRPEQTFFGILNRIRQVPTLPLRLEAVVTMTQDLIIPTRTNVYWYAPEQRYFWHRLGSRQSLRRYGQSRIQVPGLRVAEVGDFYQALKDGQLVVIGTAKSLLSSESTKRLLARLQTRSLMAAPIQAGGELLGFLVVEDNQARIWEESERNYLSATAQLVGLVASEELEATLQETQKDARFAAEIATAIAKPYPSTSLTPAQTPGSQTIAALKDCASLLGGRMEAKLFLVLQEQDNGQFSLIFAPPFLKRLGLKIFAPLNPKDRELILSSTEAVIIEDLAEDGRLMAWRQVLGELGGRSLLVAKTAKPNDDGKLSLLIVGGGTPRTWSNHAGNLVSIVAQQIHLLLLVQHYADCAQHSFQLYQTLGDGLSVLAAAPLDPVLFEQSWIDYLANCLKCPVTALFCWTSDTDSAIATVVVTKPQVALSPMVIPVVGNEFIQEVLKSRSWLCRSVTELPEAIAQSLIRLGLSQILLFALHTDETPTRAFILLACDESPLPDQLLMPMATLTLQFAWFRQYRYNLSRHAQDNETLQMLNWYKHRCLEKLQQSVSQCLAAFLDFQAVMPLPHPKGKSLQEMRHKQLLQQLQETLGILSPVLLDEEWQLNANFDSMPLAGLLKRSLHQVEPLFERQQIRLQVHNSNDKNVHGDLLKLECILYELLVTVCLCAQPGSRINLWCCPVPAGLELLIAESSRLEECLEIDSTYPSPPTINLIVCQQLLRSWGGNLQFCQLKSDVASVLPRTGRSLIKLTLPQ